MQSRQQICEFRFLQLNATHISLHDHLEDVPDFAELVGNPVARIGDWNDNTSHKVFGRGTARLDTADRISPIPYPFALAGVWACCIPALAAKIIVTGASVVVVIV
jgi:hypothetical protein